MKLIDKIDLCGAWTIQDDAGISYPGTVPGCVHTDLFTKGGMFFEKNSEKCRFIEKHDWKYERTFMVEELYENPVLVFEGLDTYCDVYLNQKKVGTADNMFIHHRFPVDGVLQEGENHLMVQFYSPVRMVEGKEELPGAFTRERMHTRRMQCTYGWDWVDRFVTCGIYRPAYITFDCGMEPKDVYVYTTNVDEYSAQIKVTEHFKGYEKGGIVKTEIIDPQGVVIHCREHYCEEEESIFYFDIESPKLWYPVPYGEHPLYTLKVTVGGNELREQFGVRTVKLLQLKDKDEKAIQKCKELQDTESGKQYDQNEEYSGFIPIINGGKIFCTGANWVPCEPFPSAETDEKITKILEKAVAAGINMIRVWGGGLFEKQHFYAECDRLGILITQDFLMACGKYPEEDDAFQEHLKKEAEYAALALRNHPSLVWWTGDNENAIVGDDTMADYRGRISARKVIAPVLEQLDYNRVFLFSSPYGGKKYASKTVGTTHNTQFLGSIFKYMDRKDLSDYKEYWKEYTARFIAEEPAMGAICRKSLKEFLSEGNLDSYELWLAHTKTNPALNRELFDIILAFARKLFGEFADWEDQYFKLKYLMYEWVRLTLGNARSNLWFNSGIVYWMLNDCWPAAVGWSFCDYYNREKAGYYAIKAHGRNVTSFVEKAEKGYKLHVTNILAGEVQCQVRAMVLDLKTNHMRPVLEEDVILAGEQKEWSIDLQLQEQEMIISEVWAEGIFQRNWYKEGLPILKPCESVHMSRTSESIEVWSESYVHVVEIEGVEGLEDNYFSLLPGERRVISYTGDEDIKLSGYTFA